MTWVYLVVFVIVAAALLYWFVVRPALQARPELKWFYDQADGFWGKVRVQLMGLKSRLLAAVVWVSGVLLMIHDFLLPIVSGIDWTPLTAQVPSWAWPLILLTVNAMFQWFRQLTAADDIERQKMIAQAAEVAKDFGEPVANIPSPGVAAVAANAIDPAKAVATVERAEAVLAEAKGVV